MRFITNNAATIARKQRQSRRACEACRRRKRRCNHILSSDAIVDDLSEISNVSANTSSVPKYDESESGHGHRTNAGASFQEASEKNTCTSRRFIGDLNPESIFRSATTPGIATRGLPNQESIGTWLVENLKSSGSPRESDSQIIRPEGIFFNTSPTTQKLLSSLLEEECFSELPSETYLSQLLSFYAEEIHPIFPLIDLNFFQSDIDRNSKILLSQAMCLLASTNPQCRGMLYLRGKKELVSPRLFGHRIFCAVRCVLDVGAISNKMVQIQALGALTLFTEGTEGPETASQLCAKMVHLVHTLGLHIQRQHEHEEEYEVTSLCCAWAIDRLNAAIHGRPVLMHERDMGRDLNKCFESQTPAFRLLLLVVSQLDQVIDLYRPKHTSKVIETEFNCPPLEDLVISAQCANLPVKFLNTIEVLYFAVVILSCRNMGKPTHSRVRQIFAASRITSIVRKETGNELIALLFTPYAVSLSLSISYKQMRYTKIPLYRRRARTELQSTCDLLDQLSDYFYTASIMAKMGKATLAEMDRVSETIIQVNNLIGHSQQSPQPQNASTSQLVAANVPGDSMLPASMNTTLDESNADFSVPDVDIFDMFDPNFGLENIDAVFQSSLDLCTPIYPSAYTGRMHRII